MTISVRIYLNVTFLGYSLTSFAKASSKLLWNTVCCLLLETLIFKQGGIFLWLSMLNSSCFLIISTSHTFSHGLELAFRLSNICLTTFQMSLSSKSSVSIFQRQLNLRWNSRRNLNLIFIRTSGSSSIKCRIWFIFLHCSFSLATQIPNRPHTLKQLLLNLIHSLNTSGTGWS